jgi:hypothetical protein
VRDRPKRCGIWKVVLLRFAPVKKTRFEYYQSVRHSVCSPYPPPTPREIGEFLPDRIEGAVIHAA